MMEGSMSDVEYWTKKFNNLRETIKIDKWTCGNEVECMDLHIWMYNCDKLYSTGLLDFEIFQKLKTLTDVCNTICLLKAVTQPTRLKTSFGRN